MLLFLGIVLTVMNLPFLWSLRFGDRGVFQTGNVGAQFGYAIAVVFGWGGCIVGLALIMVDICLLLSC